MTATTQIVTIGGMTYDTYADVALADYYLNAEPSAEAWRDADEDAKGRWLVLATRVLNRLQWKGTQTDADQPLAWPRTGVTINGVPVPDDSMPDAVVNASVELANAAANGIDISNMRTTESNQSRIKAGSVEIEYFRLNSRTATPLPYSAWALLGDYLDGGRGLQGGARSSGTSGCTITIPGFGVTRPF